ALTEFSCRFLGVVLSEDEQREWLPLKILATQAHAYQCFEGQCFVCDWPDTIKLDAQGQLHGEASPCISYRDNFKFFAWHGRMVPEQALTIEPSVASIELEPNSEIRRVLIARYGEARYLLDSGVEPFDRSEFGTLYIRTFGNDEPLVMVAVR